MGPTDKINYQFSRGWLVITKSLLSLVKELIYKAEVARVKARLALTPAGWLHCYLEVCPATWVASTSIHLHLTTLESPCQFNLAGMRFAAKNDANARDGKIWENLIFATLACFAFYHPPVPVHLQLISHHPVSLIFLYQNLVQKQNAMCCSVGEVSQDRAHQSGFRFWAQHPTHPLTGGYISLESMDRIRKCHIWFGASSYVQESGICETYIFETFSCS